jgi:hypothetical protein
MQGLSFSGYKTLKLSNWYVHPYSALQYTTRNIFDVQVTYGTEKNSFLNVLCTKLRNGFNVSILCTFRVRLDFSRQSKAKWCSTAVINFTPKELGEPSTAHSEVSKLSMKSVFFSVGAWLPQLPGGEGAVAFEDTRDGEEKKDLAEGAVTGRPRYQCMSRQDTHAPLIPMSHHPLSRQTDPHPLPLSTCLMRPRCCTSVFSWPAGAQISDWLLYVTCIRHCSQVMSRTVL